MDKKNLPDLEGMLADLKEQSSASSDKKPEIPTKEINTDTIGVEEQWNRFMTNLDESEKRASVDREERLVSKLDRDIADSLDDLNIGGHCRSHLVNAIVRTFFDYHLPKLAGFRRRKRSLLDNYMSEEEL